MKGNAKRYLILGVIFLAIGITALMTGSVSRTFAYGDFVIAFAFFAMSARESKNADPDDGKDDNKDVDKDDDKKDE